MIGRSWGKLTDLLHFELFFNPLLARVESAEPIDLVLILLSYFFLLSDLRFFLV